MTKQVAVLMMSVGLCASMVRGGIIATGDVDPADPATWTTSTTAYIGKTGEGSVTVDDGSDVVSNDGYLGYNSGSLGSMTVNGTGSTWTTSTHLYVGASGEGTLDVTYGGFVSTLQTGFIGYNSGSTGAVTVSGNGSTFTGSLKVGGFGNGTLDITDGGTVNSGSFDIGRSSGSTGVVTVSGAGSTWSNSLWIVVGYEGDATLDITDGGVVDGQWSVIGERPGSTGAVTVSGDNSELTTSGDIIVGEYGNGTLNITGRGAVSNAYGYIGSYSGSTGTVAVSGDNSEWTTSNDIIVGEYGNGTLEITDGGAVSTMQSGVIGDNSGSTGAMTVSGNGSTFTGNLGVGGLGNGALNITDGGTVSGSVGHIGSSSGSTGVVTVSGAGAILDTSTPIVVGYEGDGTLNITDGGVVTGAGCSIGSWYDSTGTVTVSGDDSEWTTSSGHIIVGKYGNGTLNITARGAVSNAYGYIGSYSGSTGAVTVSGDDSEWANAYDLVVGSSAEGTLDVPGGTLDITDGGDVSSRNGSIGIGSGSTGAVTVSGLRSEWANTGDLVVGKEGDGTLVITDGGVVSNWHGKIGKWFGSATGGVTVSGAGSIWTNSGSLAISGASSLTIVEGGLASAAGNVGIENGGFIDMGAGGMLALYGDADDSLGDFLGLIDGSDEIHYWDDVVWDWADITGATPGVDYTLSLGADDLAGYTVLTVTAPTPAWLGDTNGDYVVDGLDYDNLIAQFGGLPGDESADFNRDGLVDLEDFAIMRTYFGSGVAAGPDTGFAATAPEPATLTVLALGGLLVLRRRLVGS